MQDGHARTTNGRPGQLWRCTRHGTYRWLVVLMARVDPWDRGLDGPSYAALVLHDGKRHPSACPYIDEYLIDDRGLVATGHGMHGGGWELVSDVE